MAGFFQRGQSKQAEEYKETALREVKEETNVAASIIKYVGKSHIPLTHQMTQ